MGLYLFFKLRLANLQEFMRADLDIALVELSTDHHSHNTSGHPVSRLVSSNLSYK